MCVCVEYAVIIENVLVGCMCDGFVCARARTNCLDEAGEGEGVSTLARFAILSVWELGAEDDEGWSSFSSARGTFG